MSWSFEHQIRVAAPREFVWQFWSDFRNWAIDADIERVDLDGPFAAGAKGLTISRKSGPIAWKVAAANPPSGAVIEIDAGGATGRFEWSFDAENEGTTRVTQRASLHGPEAAAMALAAGPELAAGIPIGMEKLRAAIESAR